MRLYSITLKGYKRFADAWMNLDGKVVAIVGPNEAGKSSILDALLLLNDDQAVPATALTRGESYGGDHEVAWARFRLSAEERALAPLPLAADQGIWLMVAKTVAGPRRFRLEPAATRDRSARREGAAAIKAASSQTWFMGWTYTPGSDDEATDQIPTPVEFASQLVTDLEISDESLPVETIQNLELLLRRLKAMRSDGSISTKVGLARLDRLERVLAHAFEVERTPAPGTLAEALKNRIPRFVDFDDENRNLRSDYDLGNPNDMSRDALKNLAAMADLSLDGLRDASNVGDKGARRTIQEKAQEKLAEELKEAWKQAPIAVSFDLQGTALSITVSSHERDYFALEDRSDGLRTFIALRGFLAQSVYEVPPILLVDEAETHLHYDAQADLIRVFEQQDVAAQVIYTTHSIGCLPQDLGRGVRVVTPIPDSTRSAIENVWCREDAGVSPLMLAMGASTVPLAPSRFVVIAEGASDAMLLPSLLREATGLSSLEFQVVAGLSEASEAELARLDLEAPRVPYLVDGDPGGAQISARLRKVNIALRKIVKLSTPVAGIVIEDLVHPELYAKAVDQYLKAWPPFRGGFPRGLLGKTGRPQAVKTWCEGNNILVPSKLRVAEDILRILDDPNPPADRRLADPSRLGLLKSIHDRLLAALVPPAA